MDEKVKGICDRCNEPTNNITKMSMFNREILCISCIDKEKLHPKYREACDAELAECKKGNYNFDGVGLPDDLKNQSK